MKYLIVPVAWLIEHGVDVTNFRKNLDGTLAITHKEYLLPLINGEKFPEYEFDSKELKNILESGEW